MIFLKKTTSTTDELSDSELIKRILAEKNKKLKRSYQEDLYGRYVQKVYFRCLSIVKNKDTAKDLAHDIMVKMFLNLSKFKDEAPFGSWMFSITYNHCINFLRKAKKLRVDDLDEIEDQLVFDESESNEKELLEVKLNYLEEAFQLLKEDEKLILLMRYKDDLSVKMISINLEIGESAVKMRLKRSRDHLGKIIKELDNEE